MLELLDSKSKLTASYFFPTTARICASSLIILRALVYDFYNEDMDENVPVHSDFVIPVEALEYFSCHTEAKYRPELSLCETDQTQIPYFLDSNEALKVRRKEKRTGIRASLLP